MRRPDGERPPVVVRVPVARRDHAVVAAVVVGLFLGIAIVKPWRAFDRPLITSPAGDAPIAAASVEPGPSPTISPVQGYCNDPVGWRVATVEEFADGTAYRGWGAIQPVAATDPGDARIPAFVVSSRAVSALGYCAPPYDQPPDDATVTIYRLDALRGAEPITVIRLGPNPPSPLGALYRPPTGGATTPPATTSWTTGIYIFQVSAPGYQRWFAADVRIF